MKKTLLIAILFIATNSLLTAQIDSSLIAKFSFNSQNTLDESGNGNDATSFNLSGAIDRFGALNKAQHFTSLDSSYMSLPSGMLNTNNISISVWFQTDSSKGCIVGHQNQAAVTQPSQYVPIAYVRDTDTTLNAALWNGGSGNTNGSSLKVDDGEWHHLVIAANSNSQIVYLDGVQTGITTGYSVLTSMVYAQFGTGYVSGSWTSSGPNGYSYFDGNLDDIRIYNRKISATDVDSLFNVKVQLVESITVAGQGGSTTITTSNGTLQMEAAVLPLNAHASNVNWSVVNGTGTATINAAGLLTATADGTLEVKATANDASGVIGTKIITISNQTVGINDFSFEFLSVYPNPTNSVLNINTLESMSSIKIMDLTGKTIKVFNPKNKELNISEFTTGIYFLEIANAEKKSVIKIIKR
jgi:hypothetical protein